MVHFQLCYGLYNSREVKILVLPENLLEWQITLIFVCLIFLNSYYVHYIKSAIRKLRDKINELEDKIDDILS